MIDNSICVLSGGFDPIHVGHVNINMGKEIYFGNGGDRTAENIPELELCQELNIKMLWGLGGDKIQSSSTLLEKANGESQVCIT